MRNAIQLTKEIFDKKSKGNNRCFISEKQLLYIAGLAYGRRIYEISEDESIMIAVVDNDGNWVECNNENLEKIKPEDNWQYVGHIFVMVRKCKGKDYGQISVSASPRLYNYPGEYLGGY